MNAFTNEKVSEGQGRDYPGALSICNTGVQSPAQVIYFFFIYVNFLYWLYLDAKLTVPVNQVLMLRSFMIVIVGLLLALQGQDGNGWNQGNEPVTDLDDRLNSR